MAEETIDEVLARYEGKGFSGQFSTRPEGMVHCHACGDDSPADQTPLKALHRMEGTTDPEDEALVAAIECPACGEWGTLVMPYGKDASPEDHAVLQALMDDREHSNIQSGL